MSTALPVRSPVGQHVRAPKTAELIAAQLRGQIVRGELKAGDTLPPEITLMEQFGVSRPTLREAFRILETESLIDVRRGSRGGAQVMSPDIAVAARYVGLLLQVSGTTIADVYEARMVLEPAAAGMLAARRTRQDIIDLNRCIDDLSELIENDSQPGNPAAWADAAYRFHALMLERAGNQTLALQAGVLREVVATHMSTAVSRTFDRLQTAGDFRKAVRGYRRLVSLVEARDVAGAEQYWRTHMEVAWKRMLKDFGSTAVVDLFT